MSASPISKPASATAATAGTTDPIAARHHTPPWFVPLLTRLHFYIGIFIAPFLLVAALSGIVYALTPQLEDMLYRKALTTETTGPALPLQDQIRSALTVMGEPATLQAVRPAPEPGTTTRVMFTHPDLGPSQSLAVFVDPTTGEIRDTLDVYGTSGVLPLRSLLDRFHRGLLLGDLGRLYSELAASWLWVLVLSGLTLWLHRRRRRKIALNGLTRTPAQTLRGRHATLGAWAFLGILFFSVTGLTWSQYAGSNIGVLRAHYGWGTPSVSTDLPRTDHAHHHGLAAGASATSDEHAEHRQAPAPSALTVDPATFDSVLEIARAAGINADKLEIRPPRDADKAWTVTEVDRSWPTQVDAVSIDPRDMSILDQTDFVTFPLAAKLTRWGIDAHMGTLFGWPNQLLLIAMASSLVVMIMWGYKMWWARRPTRDARLPHTPTVFTLLRRAPWHGRLLLAVAAAALGWFLPVMGISLLIFLLMDGWLHTQRIARASR